MRVVVLALAAACSSTPTPTPTPPPRPLPTPAPPPVETTAWELRANGTYSHRYPKGWVVMPLGAPVSAIIDHELVISKQVNSFPAEAPVGEWLRFMVVEGKPDRPTACAERSSMTIMRSLFEVCRTAGPPFETTVTGSAADHGYTFHYNSATRSNPMIEQMLSTFTVTPPQ